MNSKWIHLSGHSTVLVLLIIWLVVSAVPAQSVTPLKSTAMFDIPPQSLAIALLQYTEQSGVHVTSSSALIEGKQSTGVVGRLSAREALSRLLEGTTLSFETIVEDFVVILPIRATRDSPSGDKRPVHSTDQRRLDNYTEVAVPGKNARTALSKSFQARADHLGPHQSAHTPTSSIEQTYWTTIGPACTERRHGYVWDGNPAGPSLGQDSETSW